MLDAISGGRLDAGIARAFLPYEFDAFGVSMEESRARFEEGIEALLRLWTGENVTFEGRLYRFKNVTSLPRPTQKEAREECRPYKEQYLRNFRASAKSWTGRQSGQYKPYSALEQMLNDITYARVLDETRAIIGDPDDV